jgi:hypothetical protein
MLRANLAITVLSLAPITVPLPQNSGQIHDIAAGCSNTRLTPQSTVTACCSMSCRPGFVTVPHSILSDSSFDSLRHGGEIWTVLLVGSGYILVEAEVSSSRWRTVHPRGARGFLLAGGRLHPRVLYPRVSATSPAMPATSPSLLLHRLQGDRFSIHESLDVLVVLVSCSLCVWSDFFCQTFRCNLDVEFRDVILGLDFLSRCSYASMQM